MRPRDPHAKARDVIRSDWGEIEADLEAPSRVLAQIARERGWKFRIDPRWSGRQLRRRSGLTVRQVSLTPDLGEMAEGDDGQTSDRLYILVWAVWRALGPWSQGTGQHCIARRYSSAQLADERSLALDVERALGDVVNAAA